MVFDNTDFRVVNSRTQKEAYVFAPATLKSVTYGFRRPTAASPPPGITSRSSAARWTSMATATAVVIRDSAINEGFNIAQPWAAAVGSGRPFSGNTGSADDKGNLQRNLNDNGFNRMWEYNNRGVGSTVVAEPKQ